MLSNEIPIAPIAAIANRLSRPVSLMRELVASVGGDLQVVYLRKPMGAQANSSMLLIEEQQVVEAVGEFLNMLGEYNA